MGYSVSPALSRLLQGLSVNEQMRDFNLGMIPVVGLLYFVSDGADAVFESGIHQPQALVGDRSRPRCGHIYLSACGSLNDHSGSLTPLPSAQIAGLT